MKKLILLISVILTTQSFGYQLKSGDYRVKYSYINSAVSPTVGIHRYIAYFKNRDIKDIIDLNRGIKVTANSAKGIDILLKVLRGNSSGLVIQYKNRIPYKINPKNESYNTIYIENIKRGYLSSPHNERIADLKENYKKWLKHKFNNYTLRIQDSRYSNIYKEGVEVSVKRGRVTKVLDIRSYKEVSRSNLDILTIKKLFGIAKWGIDSANISYDLKYGYPTYIKLKSGLTISASVYNQ